MTHSALSYAKEHNMLEKGDGIVVGVSGGADSMSLLLFLMSVREQYELKLTAVHVNHGIRGASADRDEHFVEDFCRKNNVDFKAVHADIPAIAAAEGKTEEEAGREFRYRVFVETCHEEGYHKIAVAHNREDNAETVLFNMFRGSGISGIRGITPVRMMDDIMLIRPLLATSRREIESYLAGQGVGYCTDETNRETEYSRNRIRNVVLPYITANINSEAVAHVASLAEQAGETESFINKLTEETMKKMIACGDISFEGDDVRPAKTAVCVQALVSLDRLLRRNILRGLLIKAAGRMKDLECVHVDGLDELLTGRTGRRIALPYGLVARRDYDRIIIERSDKAAASEAPEQWECECSDLPGEYLLPDGRVLCLRLTEYEPHLEVPKNDYTKWFDYDKIKETICMRTRRDKDYMMLAPGGPGAGLIRKSLNRYFIDTKTDREQRGSIPLLAEGSHVLWVIGGRRDDSCLITADTRTILVAEIKYTAG